MRMYGKRELLKKDHSWSVGKYIGGNLSFFLVKRY